MGNAASEFDHEQRGRISSLPPIKEAFTMSDVERRDFLAGAAALAAVATTATLLRPRMPKPATRAS